jgi:hypothetical protein
MHLALSSTRTTGPSSSLACNSVSGTGHVGDYLGGLLGLPRGSFLVIVTSLDTIAAPNLS